MQKSTLKRRQLSRQVHLIHSGLVRTEPDRSVELTLYCVQLKFPVEILLDVAGLVDEPDRLALDLGNIIQKRASEDRDKWEGLDIRIAESKEKCEERILTFESIAHPRLQYNLNTIIPSNYQNISRKLPSRGGP